MRTDRRGSLPPAAGTIARLDGVVVTAVGIEQFDCPVCEAPRDLVVPDCDELGWGECPDRACAVCGFAIVLGGSTGAAFADRRPRSERTAS